MRFKFEKLKASQAIERMLKKRNGRLNRLVLVKLLYIIDREAFKKWGHPVFGGGYFSLPHGPVISEVKDMLQFSPEFETKDQYDIVLVSEMSGCELNPAEIELIDQVFEQFGHMDWKQIRNHTHTFGEWEDPQDSRIPICVEKILHEVGMTEDQISQLTQETGYYQKIDELIGC